MTDAADAVPSKISSSKLILWGTVAGAIALSIVSAYETWLGLQDFMPAGIIGSMMALIMTFGVQIILFAISWSIAEHTRDGWRANTGRIAIWLLCACFSGYFSFYGFFQGTGGRDDNVRATKVTTIRDQIFSDTGLNLDVALKAQHESELVASTVYKAWVDDLTAMIAAASNEEAEIEKNARLESDDLRARKQTWRDKRDKLLNDRGEVNADAQIAASELETLRAYFNDINTRIEQLGPVIRELQTERDALQIQYDEESRTGVGPRARAVELDLNSKNAELKAAETALERAQQELRDLRPALVKAENFAEAGAAERRRSEIDTNLEAIEAEVILIDRKLEDLSQGVGFDLEDQTRLFNNQRADLENRNYAAYEQMVAQCGIMKQQLENAGVGQSTQSIECSNSEVRNIKNALEARQLESAEFAQECRNNPVPVGQVEGRDTYALDPILIQLGSCIDYEPQSNVKEVFRQAVGAMKTDRGDDAEQFRQASVALFLDRQGNAVLSLVFAAIVDMLVLLCALVGKNAGLPESVRALDKLTGMTRAVHPPKEGFEAMILLPDDPQLLGLIDPHINRLIREGLAELDGGDHFEDTPRLLLRRGARLFLNQLRQMESSEQTVTTSAYPEPQEPNQRRRRRTQEPI